MIQQHNNVTQQQHDTAMTTIVVNADKDKVIHIDINTTGNSSNNNNNNNNNNTNNKVDDETQQQSASKSTCYTNKTHCYTHTKPTSPRLL